VWLALCRGNRIPVRPVQPYRPIRVSYICGTHRQIFTHNRNHGPLVLGQTKDDGSPINLVNNRAPELKIMSCPPKLRSTVGATHTAPLQSISEPRAGEIPAPLFDRVCLQALPGFDCPTDSTTLQNVCLQALPGSTVQLNVHLHN
jgi:hypothetical protein